MKKDYYSSTNECLHESGYDREKPITIQLNRLVRSDNFDTTPDLSQTIED